MKFTDHFSPEKDIIKEKFKTIPYMDVWISSIIEGYIYEKVSRIKYGLREEYIERYGKKEGEYKAYDVKNNKIAFQKYYKNGKEEGEAKKWHPNGKLAIQAYYREGLIEEFKSWNYKGKVIRERDDLP